MTASTLLMITATVSSATSNPVADDTSDRSTTLTKYQATDMNNHGDAGYGTGQTVTKHSIAKSEIQTPTCNSKRQGLQLVDST